MPSGLYQRAVDLLTEEERTALGAFEARIGDHPGTDGDPVEGARVLANLREEAHLVGDGGFGEAGELAAFLRDCASRPSSTVSPPATTPKASSRRSG